MIGLATAWYLRRLGADPFIVESRKAGSGCSWGNAGWVCPSISTPLPTPGLTWRSLLSMTRVDGPLYIKPSAIPGLLPWLARFRARCTAASYRRGVRAIASLNEVTMERFAEMRSAGVDFEFHRSGILFVFKDPAKAAALSAELDLVASFCPVTHSVLGRAETYEHEPMLRRGFSRSIVVESDRHLRPETLTAGLAQALRAEGAEIAEGVTVTGFESEASGSGNNRVARALATSQGPMRADAVVLAAGVQTRALAEKAGCAIPLTAGKGYSVTVDRPKNQLRRPVYLGEAKVGLTPFDGALRFSGTMELSGPNSRLDPRRVRSLRRVVARNVRIPEARGGGKEWAGMRPMVPDTLPVAGRLPGWNNLYVNTGHQMLGVTLAASTGWAIAQLVVRGKTDLDLTPFSPSRF